jgi:hypothetical protein
MLLGERTHFVLAIVKGIHEVPFYYMDIAICLDYGID